MPRRSLPVDEIDAVVDVTRRQNRRLDILEQPDGNQLGRALEKVQALITSLPSLVTSFLSSGFSTGSISASGSISAAGEVAASKLRTTSGPSTLIATARVAAWLRNSDGEVATQTSSVRFKSELRRLVDEPGFDPFAVLQVSIDLWSYTVEVQKRDDPDSAEYVGPDYHVATNFGPIAEQLHDLGLWMVVVYEWNDDGTTKLDEHGEPIPYGVHDSLFSYVVLIALQRARDEQLRDRELLHQLARKLDVEIPD